MRGRGSHTADRVFRAVLLGLVLLWLAFPPGAPTVGKAPAKTAVEQRLNPVSTP